MVGALDQRLLPKMPISPVSASVSECIAAVKNKISDVTLPILSELKAACLKTHTAICLLPVNGSSLQWSLRPEQRTAGRLRNKRAWILCTGRNLADNVAASAATVMRTGRHQSTPTDVQSFSSSCRATTADAVANKST